MTRKRSVHVLLEQTVDQRCAAPRRVPIGAMTAGISRRISSGTAGVDSAAASAGSTAGAERDQRVARGLAQRGVARGAHREAGEVAALQRPPATRAPRARPRRRRPRSRCAQLGARTRSAAGPSSVAASSRVARARRRRPRSTIVPSMHPRRVEVLHAAGPAEERDHAGADREVGEVAERLDPRQRIDAAVIGEEQQRLGPHARDRGPAAASRPARSTEVSPAAREHRHRPRRAPPATGARAAPAPPDAARGVLDSNARSA